MYENGWKGSYWFFRLFDLKRMGTTPKGQTKGPLGEPLQFDAALTGSVHRRGTPLSVRGPTERQRPPSSLT